MCTHTHLVFSVALHLSLDLVGIVYKRIACMAPMMTCCILKEDSTWEIHKTNSDVKN